MRTRPSREELRLAARRALALGYAAIDSPTVARIRDAHRLIKKVLAAVDQSLCGGEIGELVKALQALAAELGGSGTGPTPYDLLLAALGSCTSMTVGLYARKHGWPLDDITVRLSHERVHQTDCAECVDHPRSLDKITVVLELGGALTGEQRDRLRQIAARCPVHKTLTSSIAIEVA